MKGISEDSGDYADDPVLVSESSSNKPYTTPSDLNKDDIVEPSSQTSIRKDKATVEVGLLRQQLNQATQNTKWRESLFKQMVPLVFAIESVSVALLISYVVYVMCTDRDMDGTFLSVWFVANVAQVIGILAIITNHLFPKPDSLKQSKDRSSS